MKTVREILNSTKENKGFKIYLMQKKPKRKEDYLELNMSKEQALLYLSDTMLDSDARYVSSVTKSGQPYDMYDIVHVQVFLDAFE